MMQLKDVYFSLLNNKLKYITYGDDSIDKDGKEPLVIFSGSFNPARHKHLKLAKLAHAVSGEKVWLEISITNSVKGIITYDDLRDRMALLVADGVRENPAIAGILLTNAPNFVDKFHVFNRPIDFVCGQDTLNKVMDVEYHETFNEFEQSILTLANQVTFLVAQRIGCNRKKVCRDLTTLDLDKCTIKDGIIQSRTNGYM